MRAGLGAVGVDNRGAGCARSSTGIKRSEHARFRHASSVHTRHTMHGLFDLTWRGALVTGAHAVADGRQLVS
jgi:hypothetical protein